MYACASAPEFARPRCANRPASRLGKHQEQKLLRLIADSGKFDVFLIADKNLPQQQKIEGLPFAVVVLRAKSNRLPDVIPFVPELIHRLPEFQRGHVYVLSNPT